MKVSASRFESFFHFVLIYHLPGTSEIQRLVIAQSVIKEIAGDAGFLLCHCSEE
jgi:hypothetical protein